MWSIVWFVWQVGIIGYHLLSGKLYLVILFHDLLCTFAVINHERVIPCRVKENLASINDGNFFFILSTDDVCLHYYSFTSETSTQNTILSII